LQDSENSWNSRMYEKQKQKQKQKNNRLNFSKTLKIIDSTP